jgi:hypothetical protein
MFTIANKLPYYIDGLYDIVANFSSLLNDGHIDLLYTGTNKFSSKVLGSILYEDDEELYLRYIHTLISDETLNDFLNKKITLKEIVTQSEAIFIVDKDYNNNITYYALVPITEIPADFLPLDNSFCPDFIENNSLDYTFSLKGELADLHKAEPLAVSETNTKIYNLLNSATTFLSDLDIEHQIYSEVALAGSFELNFEIDLKEKQNLFSVSNKDIKEFIFNFFKYIFNKLPDEPVNTLKDADSTSENLDKITNELKEIYVRRSAFLNEEATEQRTIDLINYTVDSFKDVNYQGFNKIEVKNRLLNGDKMSVALIDENYYKNVADKVFIPESENKPDEIIFDEQPVMYKIQVYSLNKESGNGKAYYIFDEVVNKITFHLKGKDDYHGTVFTKSLDENIQIQIMGVGKRVNNNLKEITIDL